MSEEDYDGKTIPELSVEVQESLKGGLDYFGGQLKHYYNTDFNPRAEIIGDDLSDLKDADYGNNDVEGPDARHGTHVAGIIAAVRGNGIGIDGVAGNHIQIMSVRTVPDGDEYDKDVANAIIYAVDNGAKILNMSFGKSSYKDGLIKEILSDGNWDDTLLISTQSSLLISSLLTVLQCFL